MLIKWPNSGLNSGPEEPKPAPLVVNPIPGLEAALNSSFKKKQEVPLISAELWTGRIAVISPIMLTWDRKNSRDITSNVAEAFPVNLREELTLGCCSLVGNSLEYGFIVRVSGIVPPVGVEGDELSPVEEKDQV